MALTLVQKLLARAGAVARADVGDSVMARIDALLLDEGADADDAGGRLGALLAEAGSSLADARRVVVNLAGASGSGSALREWARSLKLPHQYADLGCGPLVLAQAGHLKPGVIALIGDARAAPRAGGTLGTAPPQMTQSAPNSGFGGNGAPGSHGNGAGHALAGAVGGAVAALTLRADGPMMLAALTSGAVRVRVPPTEFMRWTGRLAPGVSAHDMVLQMRGRFGAALARSAAADAEAPVFEFVGEAIAALSIDERMTLAALSAPMGARAALFAPDRDTWAWLLDKGVLLHEEELAYWRSDEDSAGGRHSFDASSLEPLVAPPMSWSQPSQVRSPDDLGPTPIRVAVIAGAAGAKLDDLRCAARVLAGYRIAAGVQLLVAPATRLDRELAAREGILRMLAEAGATILPGSRVDVAQAAGGGAVIAPIAMPFGSTATTARNGASASPGSAAAAEVYQASPYTVAASALRGRVSDARELLT